MVRPGETDHATETEGGGGEGREGWREGLVNRRMREGGNESREGGREGGRANLGPKTAAMDSTSLTGIVSSASPWARRRKGGTDGCAVFTLSRRGTMSTYAKEGGEREGGR